VKAAQDRARKGGATIKSIGAEARKEIAEIMGVPVHLFLFVKVRENWATIPIVTVKWTGVPQGIAKE